MELRTLSSTWKGLSWSVLTRSWHEVSEVMTRLWQWSLRLILRISKRSRLRERRLLKASFFIQNWWTSLVIITPVNMLASLIISSIRILESQSCKLSSSISWIVCSTLSCQSYLRVFSNKISCKFLFNSSFFWNMLFYFFDLLITGACTCSCITFS